MVITNCDRTEEKWEVQNLYGFQNTNNLWKRLHGYHQL